MRIAGFLLILAATAAQAHAPLRRDTVLMQGNRAGSQSVEQLPSGATRAQFSYNDRNHGDRITATWTLNALGLPLTYEAHGVDYMKAPVQEQFSARAGKAQWRSRRESGTVAISQAAFYMPASAPPEFYGVLARALLKAPNHILPLLPSGLATLVPAGDFVLERAGDRKVWTQYRISGLDFMPVPVWLDQSGATAAVASLWLSTVVSGEESAVPQVLERQDEVNQAWFAALAKDLTQVPRADLLVRNARLFDPRDLTVTPGTTVLVRGERIVRVGADPQVKATVSAEIIDAKGMFLMPGLWDNHQHFDGVDGMLDVANGVTSARDMANDRNVFLKRVARFEAGTEIGPRVFKAGIIDGTGPNAGPFETLADTAEQAIQYVDWYADHGYAQIKLYMSIKPELVPIIADRAHERGLRVSGHVPAFMSARSFIEAGADEIQHFNFVELNFLYPQVRDTTLLSARFTEVAKHAREFTPEKPEVQEFIQFLNRHHTVLDPTMGLLEDRLTGSPTRIAPGLESVAPRLPPQVRRTLLGGAYEVPKGYEAAYREAIPSMLKLLKALHAAGVTIIPGTDAMAGYMLHHELELYVQAGIAPAEVLRMATLVPAQVMGAKDAGVIAPGKYADMALFDGDPTHDISDIRNVVTVIKGGKVFDVASLERALGIAPRH